MQPIWITGKTLSSLVMSDPCISVSQARCRLSEITTVLQVSSCCFWHAAQKRTVIFIVSGGGTGDEANLWRLFGASELPTHPCYGGRCFNPSNRSVPSRPYFEPFKLSLNGQKPFCSCHICTKTNRCLDVRNTCALGVCLVALVTWSFVLPTQKAALLAAGVCCSRSRVLSKLLKTTWDW